MADIPGLIEGAHEGAGIGHRFLGHVERCRVLMHLLDATSSDPLHGWHTIRNELAAYDQGLAEKPEILVLSKADAAPADYIEELRDELRSQGAGEILVMSSVSGAGVPEVLRRLYQIITDSQAEEIRAQQEQQSWDPHNG